MKVKKRYTLLLEVIIAITIVALCILPLLVPHVFLLKQQQRFLDEVELDHVVNLLYGDIILKLYKNKINWPDIHAPVKSETGNVLEIDAEMLREAGYDKPFPFAGKYWFQEILKKPKKEGPHTAYLFKLTFEFAYTNPKIKKKPFIYEYKVFLIRNTETEKIEITESDEIEIEEDTKKDLEEVAS